MSAKKLEVEFLVGLFLLIGLGILASMVVIFGRVSQGMKSTYPITVEFPNASGLVKGCDVLLSGARVGVVLQAPRLVSEHYSVAVPLNINSEVHFPRNSVFQVRTNGLLGDAYVDITPPSRYTEADFAMPGETISGTRQGGLDDLTTKGGELVDKLNTEILAKVSSSLDEIKQATRSLNENLLNERNTKNIEETFANLREVTGSFAKTSKDLDIVIDKAQGAIDGVKATLKTADSSAAELKLALADMRVMAESATKTVDSAKLLINKAASGEGPMGTLVSDKQMASDLRALVANLRRSGVLFYKDRPVPVPPAAAAATPSATTTPRPRRTH